MKIPIRNLYYIFCYAWADFPEGKPADVGIDQCPDLPNLFARLLASGANRLMRRGLDRGYCNFVEETRAPRGRILMDQTIKEQTPQRIALVCAFDELTPDVLHNQIIKTTAESLIHSDALDRESAHALGLVVRRLSGVSRLQLTARHFQRVQLSRNTAQYRPLLKLCEFVFRVLMPDQGGTGSRFAAILEDEVVMSSVFEEFLRNFYGHEQQFYSVGREHLEWAGHSAQPADWSLLPIMRTDITLRSAQRIMVVDAKYYKEALVTNRYGGKKVHAAHLYQLFAYMTHVSKRAPDCSIAGALVYPAVGLPISLQYELSGHDVRVVSIDLSRHWRDVHAQLLQVISREHADAA